MEVYECVLNKQCEKSMVVLVPRSVRPSCRSVIIFYHCKLTTQGLRVIYVVCRTSMVRLVNDIPLVSMVQDTEGLIVSFDEARNKYDPNVF